MRAPTKPPLEILLVEDNEGDVEMTRRALTGASLPCHLNVVNDGLEALEYLRKRAQFQGAVTPHVVLLDLNMPRMGGQRVLEEAKKDPGLRLIPIIVLTSSQARSDILDSYERQASGYVVKPFGSKEFISTVQQVVTFWGSVVLLPHDALAA